MDNKLLRNISLSEDRQKKIVLYAAPFGNDINKLIKVMLSIYDDTIYDVYIADMYERAVRALDRVDKRIELAGKDNLDIVVKDYQQQSGFTMDEFFDLLFDLFQDEKMDINNNDKTMHCEINRKQEVKKNKNQFYIYKRTKE